MVDQTRRQRRRRTPGRGILTRLIILLAGLAAGIYFLNLPIWQIKEVTVRGTSLLAPQEIKALAGIPLNENLFFANFSRAKANLKKISAIKEFSLHRRPPATIIIDIKERQPLAAVVFAEKSAIIDKDGYIINQNPNLTLNIPDMIDLPIISGVAQTAVLKNQHLDADTAKIISDIIQRLSRFMELKKLQLDLGGASGEMSLLLDDILKVKLGDQSDLEIKMKIFERLVTTIAGKWAKVEYLDVRFPDNPAIKYK